jgi:hypothetical protein
MPRSPRESVAPKEIHEELVRLIRNFGHELDQPDLRRRVKGLIPVAYAVRALGASLIRAGGVDAARSRILHYFRKYPQVVLAGDELMVVSGIGEWARRVRELRDEQGWRIVTGETLRQMAEAGESMGRLDIGAAKVTDYVLIDPEQDRDAAHRWKVANRIRKLPGSVKRRVLEYLKENVGRSVTGEELRYVGRSGTEWARRVRELRTEEGWAVVTRNTGRPDLPVGTYVLESLNRLPAHSRAIPDPVRVTVLKRDEYRCVNCGWGQDKWTKADPRNLELHHREQHAHRGPNTVENLVVLCNKCHDDLHRRSRAARRPAQPVH